MRGVISCIRCRRIEYYRTILILAILLVWLCTYLNNARHDVHVSSQKKARVKEVLSQYRTVLRGTRKDDENFPVGDKELAVDDKFQARVQADDKPRVTAKHDKQVNKDFQQVDDKHQILTAKHDKQAKDLQQVDDNAQALNEIKSNRADSKVQEDKVQVDEKNEDDKSIVGKGKLQTNDNIDPVIKMREIVSEINKNEVVLNDDKFPSFGLVMIIQVHRRIEYLKILLESLRDARDISEVLLVVSFDYYDEELFSVVDKVDFCKVIVIYCYSRRCYKGLG